MKNYSLGQLKGVLGNLAPGLKFQFVTNGIFVFAAEPNYFGINHYQTNLEKSAKVSQGQIIQIKL